MARLLALALVLALFPGAVLPIENDLDRLRKARLAASVKIARFVTWPAFEFGEERFQYCLWRHHLPLEMLHALRAQRVSNRELEIREVREVVELEGCRLLYVPESLDTEFWRLQGDRPVPRVLMVGESRKFLDSGGSIALLIRDGYLRFLINPQAVRSVGLYVDSELLAIARSRGAE